MKHENALGHEKFTNEMRNQEKMNQLEKNQNDGKIHKRRPKKKSKKSKKSKTVQSFN